MHKKPFFFTIVLGAFVAAMITLSHVVPAQAANTIAISPLYQTKVLIPGEKEPGSFTVFNPASNDEDLNYEAYVRPFWANEENVVEFSAHEDYSQMADWITIDNPTGTVAPNESNEITFTINVPEDAPAGGQYASIVVKSLKKRGNTMISETYEMAHLVYAEVAGKTVRSGEIFDVTLPGFMFSGKITGGATVKNDGNVHSNTVHTLKVSPLFGGEELFTNEENPQEDIVMPGSTRYTAVTWNETPSVGIFRVSYTAEFEGVKKELSKIIIICPIWLLAIIVALVVVVVYSLLSRKSHRRKDTTPETA